ncbi:tubulin--tyrosine ligase-like protein 12 [Lycorma delicatula]|uniref:tubulin--tyrosine ligase-like protein 12 n=1 Tax=Lycorma delicatula TaxID=130591 RepID=UPI003F51857B
MDEDIRYTAFLQLHKPQLVLSAVPERFWKILYKKLNEHIFDANEAFALMKMESEEEEDEVKNISNYENQDEDTYKNYSPTLKVFVSCENGVLKNDENNIYLIDHAWTYTPKEAKQHLLKVPGLLDRMCNLMGIDQSGNEVDEVYNEMWKYNQTYSISSGKNVEDRLPVWYIMDEFGSAIQHCDDPNFRVVPFAFASEGITYSIMFPVKDVFKDEEVTRDYVEGFSDPLMRKSLLLPWFPADFRHISFIPPEPLEAYFTSGHLNETLPGLTILSKKFAFQDKSILKVYSDYEFINNYLTDKRFQIVNDEKEADILWYTSHFTDFNELSITHPEKYINQFPYEFVITVKDLLAIICRRSCKDEEKYDNETLEILPSWLPETFNLNTELPQFISYFQWRKDKQLDNHWICKPWNLARGLDTYITNNVNFIIRLPNSGPKIAQKYIHNPILFYREDVEGSGLVKFDIRYVLLLKSVKPLEAYTYKNFFLRFANKSFELNDFDIYEKHFTVMNYGESTPLHRLLCNDFIKQFEKQYPSVEWKSIEEKIFKMFREMFEAAVEREPPCGIGESPQSRALYAADLMLSYSSNNIEIEPKLLEINWIPDCERACLYYNEFYNDIFSLLFLNETKNVFHKL